MLRLTLAGGLGLHSVNTSSTVGGCACSAATANGACTCKPHHPPGVRVGFTLRHTEIDLSPTNIRWPISLLRKSDKNLYYLLYQEPVSLGHQHIATTKSQYRSIWVLRDRLILKGAIVFSIGVTAFQQKQSRTSGDLKELTALIGEISKRHSST